jgi:hypothetical protein
VRLVDTSPRRFECAIELTPLIHEATDTTAPNNPFTRDETDDLKDNIYTKLAELLPDTLTRGLGEHALFAGDEFSPVVTAAHISSLERIHIDVKVTG